MTPASQRQEKPCPDCDGNGQVHHGEGALSYVTLCPDRDCALRRDAEFMGVSRADIERYFAPAAAGMPGDDGAEARSSREPGGPRASGAPPAAVSESPQLPRRAA